MAGVGLVQLGRRLALVLISGARRGDKTALAAVGRCTVHEVAEKIDVEQAQLVHNDNLRRPHDARPDLACRDDFAAPARVRRACEGWTLGLVGFPDRFVPARAAPGEDAGCKGAFKLVVGLEDQDGSPRSHMPEASGDQRGGLAGLDATADRDLFEVLVVEGVEHVSPRRRGDAERAPGAGSVRDHEIAESPTAKGALAHTARGHKRGATRHASFARLAIAAVASS